MSTLQEQRMIAAHKLGRRDYLVGLSLLVPKLYNREEQSAYIAGYEGERKRSEAITMDTVDGIQPNKIRAGKD